LSDTEKRTAYDQLGRGYRPGEDFKPPPNWDAGFEFSSQGFRAGDAADFSDFFATLFGRVRGGEAGGFSQRRQTDMRGGDHQAKVMLDLEDSFSGASRQISLRLPRRDPQGGVMLENRVLNVKIPKGVCEGQVIRLAGQGAPGYGQSAAGDLLLEVHFNPHSRFRVEGRHLHLNLPVTPWEAALGASVEVNLLGGNLKVHIPEDTQSGRQLRLVGKGMPCNPPGDLLLEVQVVLPPVSDPKARAIYEAMAKTLVFDPRSSNGRS
jgi:curved DNA-binding protein